MFMSSWNFLSKFIHIMLMSPWNFFHHFVPPCSAMNEIKELFTYNTARICNIVCRCIELQFQGTILATSDAVSFSSIEGMLTTTKIWYHSIFSHQFLYVERNEKLLFILNTIDTIFMLRYKQACAWETSPAIYSMHWMSTTF